MNVKATVMGAGHFLVKRLTGQFWLRRHWLKETEWLSKGELDALQLRLFKKLVRHCYETVPYYRNLMDRRRFRPEDIKSLSDVKLFPILKKKDVLANTKELVSLKHNKLLMNTGHTSGTSGTPMDIKRDIRSIGDNHAFFQRQKQWGGIGLTDRCAYLTGRLIAATNDNNGQLYAYDPFMKELILSTYHLSRQNAVKYARAMYEYDVKAIDGYPSAVHLLARTCLEAGIYMNLRACFTTSETLTDPMRETIGRAFNCRVYDYYGNAERTGIIHTCDYGSRHIVPEYGITELIPVDESSPQRCKVIGTGFWNRAMPFIRYDMEDIVIKSDEKCPCGRAFEVVKSIEGRYGDVVRTPSGREFGMAAITHLIHGADHIVESQVVQETLEHVTIEYVPDGRFSKKDYSDFSSIIHRHLPDELKVDLKEVTAVSRTSSGKVRQVVSQI